MLIIFIIAYSCKSIVINDISLNFIVRERNIGRLLRTKMVSKSTCVGIERTLSEYISHIKPKRVEGYVKVLLEDFHVHEIDTDGKVLTLGRSYKIEEIRRAVESKKRRRTGEKFLSSYERYKTRIDYPSELFTEADKRRMDKLLQTLSQRVESDGCYEQNAFALLICSESEDTKSTRTSVHRWIRTNMPFLDSKTVDFKTCLKNEKLRGYLGSYLDFSTLPQDYNLIQVSPTQVCVKYIASRPKSTEVSGGCNVDSTSAYNLRTDSSTTSGHEHVSVSSPAPDSGLNHAPSSSLNSSHSHGAIYKNNVDSDSDSEGSVTLDEIVRQVDQTDYGTFNPKSYGRFLHFNLLKINRETSEVVHMMCKSANRASFDFFSAGNKDKRGITVQRLCIRRCNIESVLEAMTRGWYNDVYLSDFCYKNTKIGLGDLNGNHFKVVIRGIEDSTNVHKSIETLKSHGFINYFGLQRFGTKIVGTHVIGASIIDQRYEMTLRLILGDIEMAKNYEVFNKYFENMDPIKLSINPEYLVTNANTGSDIDNNHECNVDINDNHSNEHKPKDKEGEEVAMKYRKAADYYLLDNDAQTALKYIPMRLHVEKSILKGIAANLKSEKCLEKVPKNILSIYVHSTQSLLFNLAATERLNRYGLKVVPGDLVVTGEKEINESGEDYEETRTKRDKRVTVIEVATEEEAQRYTIEQVVLPLPGDNVTYPRNMRDYYEKIAKENYGIELDSFKTNRMVEGKSIRCIVSVGGSYRFIIVKPKDVSYEFIETLEDPLKVLIRPEIEEYEEDLEKYESEKSVEKIKKLGEKIRNKAAIILKCSLPKSSYITVALREILKDESIENNHG